MIPIPIPIGDSPLPLKGEEDEEEDERGVKSRRPPKELCGLKRDDIEGGGEEGKRGDRN